MQTAHTIRERNAMAQQTFQSWIIARAEGGDEENAAAIASIMGQILSAPNVAQLLEENAPLHVRDIVRVPLLLHGFDIREGEYEESPTGYYAAMHVTRVGSGTEEHSATRIVTCGAVKVLAKLMMIEYFVSDPDNDVTYPIPFWFSSKELKSGNTVYDMVHPVEKNLI